MSNEVTQNHLTTAISQASAASTSGDARRLILETMAALKVGAMDPQTGMAIAAGMKVLNDSIFAEVAAAKLAIQAKKEGLSFGRLTEMGRQQIG